MASAHQLVLAYAGMNLMKLPADKLNAHGLRAPAETDSGDMVLMEVEQVR